MTFVAPYYSDSSVQLFLGDMREVLPRLVADGLQPDLVIADPPYEETGYEWDRWPAGWLDVAASASSAMWCWLPLRQFASPPFRGVEFAAAGWKLSQDIEGEWDHVVWEKHNGSSSASDRFKRVHELATFWYRGRWDETHHETPTTPDAVAKQVRRKHRPAHWGDIGSHRYTSEDGGPRLARSVIRSRSAHGRAIHPTQKPVDITDLMVTYACPPDGLVLDVFAGSGTTAVAARLSGRRAVLIERDERYAEAIARRLAQDVLPIGGVA